MFFHMLRNKVGDDIFWQGLREMYRAFLFETAVRKITHYGKYSYLAFSDGRNRDKGTWRVEGSPLIHRFGQKRANTNKHGD